MSPALLTLLLAQTPEGMEFARDVVPALTKVGCNSGACHGSFQGRGGFRLSLLGFDPTADYDALVREGRGRRLFPAVPEQSLILLKPTGAIPHGGGKRLTKDDASYRILLNWMRQGMPGLRASEPTLNSVDVRPREILLEPSKRQALKVTATWSDGLKRDVTDWCYYESSKDAVASVSRWGVLDAIAPGRSAVMIRYQDRVAAVPVTVPYPPTAGKSVARQNYIDDHLADVWKQVRLDSAPLCDDATFLRRVSLDLIGTLPTPEEIQRFLATDDPKQRAKLIDKLLERPEYVDQWAIRWGDLLRVHRRALGEKGLASFNGWLKTALRENRPIDKMVRELLTARGNLYKNGAVAFYFVDKEPADLAETTAQVFLGIRIGCAKCHHHPFEVWSQDDYNGLAEFFTRMQRKDSKDDGLFGGSVSLGVAPLGKSPPRPRILGGPVLTFKEGDDPRERLAEWVTGRDNPWFARSIVNRAWGALMGRGLVEPVDDLRATNPATHPELLDVLTRDFIDHKYDLKYLLRTICNSAAYQLDCDIAPKRDSDGVFFACRKPRRVPAEVLLDAVNQAAGTTEDFLNLPPGTRAIALPDPAVASTFLDTFGRPNRSSNCDCARGTGSDLAQVLHFLNGEKLHIKVTAKGGRVARLLNAKAADDAIVEELYLATLSRQPSKAEREKIRELLSKAPSRQEAFEDLLWALLSTNEFGMNR